MTDWKVKPSDALDAEETERVMKLVEGLPELTRQVITLRKTYGYSQDEIAKRLGITSQQVEDEIVKAVQACADMREFGDEH
jgi:RNA polymerase sigma factor (sigma-70 family)